MHKIIPLLGARVRQLREARGLTQAGLAESCDLAVQTISRIERGVKAPSIEVLASIAEALDVPPASLLAFGGVTVSMKQGSATAAGGQPADAEALRLRVERAIRVLTGED